MNTFCHLLIGCTGGGAHSSLEHLFDWSKTCVVQDESSKYVVRFSGQEKLQAKNKLMAHLDSVIAYSRGSPEAEATSTGNQKELRQALLH